MSTGITSGAVEALRIQIPEPWGDVLPWICDLFGAVQTMFNPTRRSHHVQHYSLSRSAPELGPV
jgi:hypothetical protein